LINRIGILTNN